MSSPWWADWWREVTGAIVTAIVLTSLFGLWSWWRKRRDEAMPMCSSCGHHVPSWFLMSVPIAQDAQGGLTEAPACWVCIGDVDDYPRRGETHDQALTRRALGIRT